MIRTGLFRCCSVLVVMTLMVSWSTSAQADEKMTLAEGKISLEVPKTWKRKKPKSRIIEHEFEAPAKDEALAPGRVTAMGAGGSIEANIARWIGQFTQPDGKSTKERTKQEKLKVAGQTVYVVDISGNFKDQRGPFAPAVMRKDYRMLGAIISTDKVGQYFVKLYGPKKTVAEHEAAFQKMIRGMQVKGN